MIVAHLAALDRLVDGRVALDADDVGHLAVLQDELGLPLVGPDSAATPSAVRLAGPARAALQSVQAFFDDADVLACEHGRAGARVLELVRPARTVRPRAWRRPDAI